MAMYVIANPAAGRGRGGKALERVRSLLGPEDELVISQGPGDSERLAVEAVGAGRPVVTVMGGDGTLGEVINGIAASGFQAALGVLPVGTANDFAIYLGVPTNLERAVAIIRAGHIRRVDLGLIERGGRRPDGRPSGRRYFATTIGVGLGAAVARLAQSGADKAHGSPLTYLRALPGELLRFRPIEVEITGGEVTFRGKALTASISNGEQEGGVFHLAPGARVDDGFLHLLILGDVPSWQRPWYILQSVRGGAHKLSKAHLYHVKAVSLRTLEDAPFYVDGEFEPLSAGEVVQVRVEEGKLSAVAPPPTGGG
jgi:diacylglycerol kinase (ATP)